MASSTPNVIVQTRSKMKLRILFLLVFIWQNQSVKCNIFDDITVQFGRFSRFVSTTFDGIFDKVQNFINRPPRVVYIKSEKDMFSVEEELRLSFNDFVERMAVEPISEEFPNMRSEPTALMSTPQLSELHGKQIDTHVVKTSDGYLLTLHRIKSSNNNNTKITNQTVLLHHGLMGSSADWILLGPERSLPYILSSAGYDVWMANARGNYYSRAHVIHSVKSPKFWNFSWQEIGEYDLPAIIDYIMRITNKRNDINFVGHSMGATALLVLLSTNPQYNNHLRMGILLGPLVFMDNIKGPLKLLKNMSYKPPYQLLKAIGDTEFLPSRKIPKMISKKFCKGPKIYCNNPLLFLAGGLLHDEKHNASFIARLLYHVPAGASTNTILHYGQLIQNGKFHRFNRQNSDFPLERVTLPIVLFGSDEDILAPIADILRLYLSISNPLDQYLVRDKNLSHTEFVWGAEADKWIFPKVMNYLEYGLIQEVVKDNEV